MSEKVVLVNGIPGFSNYAITSGGKHIYSLITRREMKQRLRPNGYMEVSIKGDDGVQRSAGVHRLVASVFVDKPRVPGKTRLVVNHIDGVKTNNDYRNLEWITYKENAEHAGVLGLTDKCKPISIRDCVTGVVKKYPSFIEAAKDLGVTKDNIAWRFRKEDEAKVYPELKQYRLGHDDRPWKNPCFINGEAPAKGNQKPVLIKCLKTNIITKYDRISDYAKTINVSPALFTKWLNMSGQPVLPGLFQMKLVSDPEPWRKVLNPKEEELSWGHQKRVKAVNVATGEVEEFESAVDCARKLGILTSTLNLRLKSEGNKVYSDNRTYAYI